MSRPTKPKPDDTALGIRALAALLSEASRNPESIGELTRIGGFVQIFKLIEGRIDAGFSIDRTGAMPIVKIVIGDKDASMVASYRLATKANRLQRIAVR